MPCSLVCRCAMPFIALQCFVMQFFTAPRRARTYYAQARSSTPCHAVQCDASRTLSGSLPCSTSDCEQRGYLPHGKGWEEW
eukprot:2413303-Pyramimonas_sp.AAC.1